MNTAYTDEFLPRYGAFKNGKPRDECPFKSHPATAAARREWLAGWDAAQYRAA
jgi:ribosome modulation factor